MKPHAGRAVLGTRNSGATGAERKFAKGKRSACGQQRLSKALGLMVLRKTARQAGRQTAGQAGRQTAGQAGQAAGLEMMLLSKGTGPLKPPLVARNHVRYHGRAQMPQVLVSRRPAARVAGHRPQQHHNGVDAQGCA